MNMHKNARLTPRGRERIVRQVESGQTPEAVAEATIEGRLPHGMGVTRLIDLPAEWSRQHQLLGLPAQ